MKVAPNQITNRSAEIFTTSMSNPTKSKSAIPNSIEPMRSFSYYIDFSKISNVANRYLNNPYGKLTAASISLLLLYGGISVGINKLKAFKSFKKAEETSDINEKQQHLEKATKLGHAKAADKLFQLIKQNWATTNVVHQNLTQNKLNAYKIIADTGHAEAQYELGLDYYNHGDFKEANKWMTKAAHAKYPEAINTLAKWQSQ